MQSSLPSGVGRPISSSISSQFQKQKPVEWISSLIQRYQDQLPTNTGKPIDRETRQLLNTSHTCIINVSRHHLHLVILALVRVLKGVNSSRWTSEVALSQSRMIVLQTLLECLNEAEPTSGRNVERECCMKNVLEEMWILISCTRSGSIRNKAIAVVSRVGALHSGLMLSRLERALHALKAEECDEEQNDLALAHINIMSNVMFSSDYIIKIISLTQQMWPVRKEHLEPVCNMLTSVLWKWIEGNPAQFSSLQHTSNSQISEVCDALFLSMNTNELRRRAICWPVQMMLIAISPVGLCSMDSNLQDGENIPVNLPPIVVAKKQFLDSIVAVVQSYVSSARPIWSGQVQYACHAAVNLCKCATFVTLSDFFIFTFVQSLIEHVKSVLLTGSRPREMDRKILVDCFVSLFRLKFDNDMFRVCLTSNQPILQLVLVEALIIISTQPRLHWWPKIDMIMSRSDQLRTLLMSVIEKVLETDPISSASGHIPLSVSRSWQKMSGKFRVERGSACGGNGDSNCSQQRLLVALLKLITTQPLLLIRQRGKEDEGCIDSIVSALVLLIDHPQLHSGAMQALLALHSVIPYWNSTSPRHAMQSFFTVGSHMLFSVCQKLIHFQIPNAEHVITWIKAIMQYRIDFVKKHYDLVTDDHVDAMTTQSLIKFEAVCFLYLWSCDSDMVLCALSLFELNAIHTAQISSSLASSLSAHLSCASNIITAGRVVLQKSIYKHLRTLPHCNAALNEAWHESYRIWELFTNHLVYGCKDHVEFIEHVTRIAAYSSTTTDVNQSMVDVWSNISGFLCSLSHLVYANEQNHVTSFLSKLLSVLRVESANMKDIMCKNVKELISFEMDYSLDHFILHTISVHLVQNTSNGQFVEHVIYILKNMLSRRSVVVLKTESTIQIISALLVHAEQPGIRLDPATHGETISNKSAGSGGSNSQGHHITKQMTLVKKLSSLISLIIDNSSTQKIPTQIQSKLIEYFINTFSALPGYSNSNSKCDAVLAVLQALSKLLGNMSIALSPINFNKVFNLLVETFSAALPSFQFTQSSSNHNDLHSALVPPASGAPGTENIPNSSPEVIANIEDYALAAVAHLVGSNLELGIARLIDIAWTGEPKLRRWILEAICRVLSQKSSGNANTLSEINAQQCELLKLITLISDEGGLPLVNALINALPSENMDQLSRVLVIAFSERHLLSELLWTVLVREAECVMSPSTLFRGSSLAAKIIGYCFRVFGHAYLYETLSPLFQHMQKTPDRSYEIEQDRLPPGSSSEAGVEATQHVAEMAFNLILKSEEKFPHQLKTVCHAIYHVINSRFPNSGLSALGKILFLRFFNPAIVSPYENQMMAKRPTRAMSRGLTLISKILQYTVNQPSRPKDTSMIHFQQLTTNVDEAVTNFLSAVALNETVETWMDTETSVQPSVNLPLLQNIHELFSGNRCEIVRQLRLLSTHTNLCSRIDALLHALPDQLPTRQLSALSDACDPSLPAFYQINNDLHHSSPHIYILVLRRVMTSDLDTVKKQIEERSSKGKFICVIDCLCCEYPTNLAKLFPTNILQSIERFVILFCSPKVFTQLSDAHFSKLPIFFDLSGVAYHFASLPPLTLRQMSTQASSVYRAKILSANETDVIVKLIDNIVKIDRERRWRGRPITVSEIFPCTAFEQVLCTNNKTITFLINENHIISLRLEKAKELVDKIFSMRSKNSVAACADAHIQLQANFKDVVTLALVNMADQDVGVRCVAYRLLNTLSSTLNLDISSKLQETPCVFVPTNTIGFLTPIIDMLVENEPTLLLNLLGKIIYHPNASFLIEGLKNAWNVLDRLEDEQIHEIFSLLISATSMRNSFSALILNDVWPIIGKQTPIIDILLNHLLDGPEQQQLLIEIAQPLVTESPVFSTSVINRIMVELNSTENKLPKLLTLLLTASFDPFNIDIEAQLPNLMHMTTCLAGNGSRFIRCTVFAIVSNIFHGFGVNSKYNFSEEFHRCLGIFLRQLNSEETLRLFNVSDYGSGQAVVDAVMTMVNEEDDTDAYTNNLSEDSGSEHQHSDGSHEEDNKQQVSLSNIHQLVSLMIAIVADIEKAADNKKEWLAEWRTMARNWVFQSISPPSIQIRSLIAYSCLATSVSDADIKAIVFMLLQVVKRRESLTSISGVTLSLIRLHILTPSNSVIHRFIFWIAILLFQLEHATIYEYAIQLLHANLVNLDQMGVFEHTNIEKMAMESRVHLEWDMKALDQYAGLSFKANFNFALAGYLLKGLRQPYLSAKVLQLLQLLLRITAKCSHSNPFILTKETLPYLLALLPFDEKVQQRFRLNSSVLHNAHRSVLQPQWAIQGLEPPDVFTDNPVISVWNEDEEEETTILLDPNIINEEQLQSLTVTVLAILARSCPNVHIVLDYLLEAVSVFPSVVPVIECLLDQRIVGLVQSCHSVQMLSTVVRLIETSASEDSPSGITPQQVCSFLQQSGFAGLWRYAGAFLSPMRQIYRSVEKDGSGVVKLMCDEPEDMWHLYNIIRIGDKVRSKTLRKILNESATGSKTSQRIQLTLEVEIEAIDYDPSASSIHLRGKNVLLNEHVKLGAYHTVDLELNRPFSLWKSCWDVIDFQRLEEALDSGKNADVAAVIMHEGLANVCILTSTMTIVKAKIDMAVARKRKGFTGQHDKAIIRFLDAVSQAFLRHVNLESMKCIIVASRGFLKDQFMTHLFEVADKQGKRISTGDKSKFIVLPSSSGFKHALKEILTNPAVASRLADTKAQAEVKALNQFLELLNADCSRAFYGFKHVTKANEKGAVDTLMLSDALFRSNDVVQRKQYIELSDSVKNQGGNVLIFSSMHVSGEQLNQITGVAAILRFPLPEVLPFGSYDHPVVYEKFEFKESADTGAPRVGQLKHYDVMITDHKILYSSEPGSSSINSTTLNRTQETEFLNVHVVMHSHVDPGWLSTFEEYFEQKVHSILNLTVHHLSKNPDMRFIWSEMSFLERWWRVADDDQKQKMRQIVKDRKLELTGGAWVMTDEATPFFWGTIDNMIEGHHFVKKTFNIVPTTSWSVDPFGHGLMIPYLLSESRISSMVIGRLDADLKAELRKKRLLLFNWAQPWDENGNSATPLVTALPRTYYTTADSCGTNPTVCCMFDLGPSARSYCTKRANDVNDANVDSYAKQLTDQYRQLSPFYLGNTVLVPIGDDFFFSKDADWTITHSNYKKIFDYVNSNQQKFNMKVQFSTVEEYFQKVSEANVSFPLFTGDFFPYTEDKSGTYPYWTGFYVHMPFFKRAERLTEGKLRAIDFMSVLSNFADVTENIRPARRDLALCQHHDSITGTSKPHVMIDYQTRLRNAFSKFDEAMKEIVERKISPNAKSSSLLIFPQESPDGISNLNSIVFTSEKKSHDLLIFHQGSQYVKQKITLRVNDPRILVLQNENPIEAQILPVMNFKEGQISNSIYELVFFVQLGPFEAKNIHLDWILDQPKTTTPSMVFSSKSMNSSCFILMNLNSTKFSLSNRHFSVQFEDGLIASMKKAGENTSTVLQVTFKGYLDRGGAYTFVSNGPSSNMHRGQIQTVPFTPIFVVGPIVSKAITRTSASLFQTAIIDNGDALSDLGIHLELFSNQGDLDITQMMVIKTNIRNQDEFHTDVNGMYFLKRKINKEVAFEGNIYPVASSVFVEDEDSRLTVLSGQPTGATVDKNTLEIMLDRRLSGEDGKGLSRGDASHSPPSLLKFDLLFESKNSSSKDNYSVFFSSLSYFALQNLLYPPELLLLKEKQKETESWGNFKWSCNIELINIRYLDEQTGLILLRRLPFDQTLPQVKCLEDDFKNLYNGLLLFSKKTPLILTSLTGTVDESMIVDEKILENLLKVPLKILALKFILD